MKPKFATCQPVGEGRPLNSAQARLRIYAEHRPALVDYATPIVGSRDSAEDVVQEAYFRFVPTRPPLLLGLRTPVGYLYRIARNIAIDWTRRDAAEQRRNAAYALTRDPQPLSASAEDELLCGDEARLVLATLASLPEKKRRAYEMSVFGEMSSTQIAQQLGVSRATAHRLVQDAMIHVMRSVERMGPEGDDDAG
ncbi:MAG: RNA polymerase subunit sigma-24 [Novosphingobium pentaromativorans]|uniref:RNA polymerase subunit sigma-24 n=1 Tax=Novosphingobium pentaromativorans TaxID=205844 RepID=A0A2W5NH20_9SPHN|nr:MAG: RNA polymerase subunit sigma-24 [Novosphingobium pentaromativorans]